MARITIEDCLDQIPNRFQLTLLATQRARQLAMGSAPMVVAHKDKPTVTALREIAAGKLPKESTAKFGVAEAVETPPAADAQASAADTSPEVETEAKTPEAVGEASPDAGDSAM